MLYISADEPLSVHGSHAPEAWLSGQGSNTHPSPLLPLGVPCVAWGCSVQGWEGAEGSGEGSGACPGAVLPGVWAHRAVPVSRLRASLLLLPASLCLAEHPWCQVSSGGMEK